MIIDEIEYILNHFNDGIKIANTHIPLHTIKYLLHMIFSG